MKVAIIIAWILCGLSAAGAFNASFRANTPKLHQSPMWAAKTQAFSIGLSVFGGPLALALSPVLTGGYYAGWTLTREPFPCITDSPEIWCKP